jgi:hypothetical protein
VTTLPWQVLAPQEVPCGWSWQAPVPLQTPVCPQLDAACVTHSLSGSTPSAIGPHTPSEPLPFLATVHAWQRPTHAVLQQTPSTQEPDAHCALFKHAPPFPRGGIHAPMTQAFPAAQSAFVAHAPWQAPFEHAYGAQSCPVEDAMQVPTPSQI